MENNMYTTTDRPIRAQFIQCAARDQQVADVITIAMACLAPFVVLLLTISI